VLVPTFVDELSYAGFAVDKEIVKYNTPKAGCVFES
jgi:hypothetical protein